MLHELNDDVCDSSSQGSILHYSVEAPLFRYRNILQVAVLKREIYYTSNRYFSTISNPMYFHSRTADQTLLCPVVRGEIYILPPHHSFPEQPLDREQQQQQQVMLPLVTASNSQGQQMEPSPPLSQRGRPFARRRVTPPEQERGLTLLPMESEGARAGEQISDASEELMHPSPVGPTASEAALQEARSSGTDVTAVGEPCRSPRVSGDGRAQSRMFPKPPPMAAASAKTPAARPTKSKIVLRVEAEPLANGPAAIVVDR